MRDIARIYGEQYGPEAGPWNLSLESKYLEYAITRFFEESFTLSAGGLVCNVGIGAGYWDRYLSYRPGLGGLVSVDIDKDICESFAACLENEGNPGPVTVLNRDIRDCGELLGRFDMVTMVGSSRMEAGKLEEVLGVVFSLVKPGGSVYYQTLYDDAGDKARVEELCGERGMRVERFQADSGHRRVAHYWKLIKEAGQAGLKLAGCGAAPHDLLPTTLAYGQVVGLKNTQ